MATSPARHERRKTQRRKQKAAGLVAAGAAGALLAGTAIAPPAEAAPEIPFVVDCEPGGYDSDSIELSLGPINLVDVEATADCRNAQKAIIGTVADAVLGLFVDLPIGISSLNRAFATPGIGFGSGITPFIDGIATIEGTGFNTALVILGGEATAKSDYYMAGAVALASLGGKASAESLFGGALAMAVGNPLFGSTNNSASANSLPMGLAIANSSNIIKSHQAASTALIGIASASAAVDGSIDAVCTAAYGEASVKDKDGKNVQSCTSLLFIFQQSQQGEDPVIYAIKNPLDIGFVSPFGDNIATLLADIGSAIGGDLLPEQVIEILAGKFVPEFQSDIIRISFENGTPKLGTDLPEWLEGLFGGLGSSTQTNPFANLSGLNPNAVSQALGSAGTESSAAAGDQPSVLSALADTGAGDAPTAQRTVNTLRGDVTVTDAPEVKQQNLPPLEVATQTPPPASEPVVTTPAPEPIVTAPAPEPVVTAPAPEPVVQTPPAVETVTPPAAADSVDLVPAS